MMMRAAPRIALAVVGERQRTRELIVAVLAAGGLAVDGGTASLVALEELTGQTPALLVLVADIASGSGLAALRRARKAAPAMRIVVVAPENASGAAGRATLNAGADAFVPDCEAERALVPAVHAVLAGLVCAPRQGRRLLAKPVFSHREKEVLALVAAGFTNNQIADRLYLAESTVKTHLVSAFAKLGVRSRKEAAALLLDPAEGLAATALPPRLLPLTGPRLEAA
jgi:DNA-binding NarL/FixJ family response regulator